MSTTAVDAGQGLGMAAVHARRGMRTTAIRRGFGALFMACGVWLGTTGAALAETPPPQIASELPQARLAGEGNFRYFGMNIYDAQFWVGANGFRSSAPRAEKFALDLRYARALVGKRIADSSADEIAKLGLGTAQQRADWLERMQAIFPDVREGTHLTGVYLPRQGVRFYLDGKQIGEILDPEFGYAFFAIWLDPKTTGADLRRALLADAAPR